MHKIFFISCLVISSIGLSASFLDSPIQGNGILKKETRSITNFNKVSVNGVMTVSINCQKQKLVDIEGDTNIVPVIKTYVSNNVLNISLDKKYKENQPLKININIPDINDLNIKGSSKLSIQGLKNNKLDILIQGTSDLTARGQSKNLSIDILGSGYVDTKNLKSENTVVELKGTSMVDVFASKSLDAKISGFGKINYYGNPKNIKKSISGTGFITQAKK